MKMHLLTIEEITHDDLLKMFDLASRMKKERGHYPDKPLAGKSVGMIFSKSSTRTRVSFEVGVRELGGNSIYLDQNQLQLGRGETIADTARVLSRYLHGIIIRTYKQSDVIELAKYSRCPVINALTNEYHPCQVLTDLFTMYELSGDLKGTKLVFLGDGASNMGNSLMLGSKLAGIDLTISAPEEFKPDLSIADKIDGSGTVKWEVDPVKAVADADYIYTDVWVSMGFEEDTQKRLQALKPYQLNMDLLSQAPEGAKVLHCLPAHRSQEITHDVMECEQSVVFDQAENRLHVQKAILSMLIWNEEDASK